MNLVTQPFDSNLCGQSCVAMIAGIDLRTSISVVGKRGKTCTKDLVMALETLHIKTGKKLVRIKGQPELPRTCVMKVIWKYAKNQSHWVVYHDNKYYDPALGILEEVDRRGRVSSYLEVNLTT